MINDATTPEITQATEIIHNIKQEISRAVLGQGDVVDHVLMGLLAGGHVLIEGVPGTGKTLLVRALAKTFDGQHARIQFTPDLMPADVTGHVIYDMKQERFNVRKGPIFTNLLLADEINRAPAKTQSALLEVMQEQQATIEGESMQVPKPFMTIATQNPLEQEGTYPLPEAQLDRFLIKILVDYPEAEDENRLVELVTQNSVGDQLKVEHLSTLSNPETIVALQQQTASIRVDEEVMDYCVRLVRQTREWNGITVGAGSRGAIAIVRTARAHAMIHGRDFCTPDDVKAVALPCLRHRISLAPELELEGLTADQVLLAMIDQVEAPRQ